MGRLSRRWRTVNHIETESHRYSKWWGRAIRAISAILTTLRLPHWKLGRLLQRFGAEVLWFCFSRNSEKYFRGVLA